MNDPVGETNLNIKLDKKSVLCDDSFRNKSRSVARHEAISKLTAKIY
jgi:hypothetical protein